MKTYVILQLFFFAVHNPVNGNVGWIVCCGFSSCREHQIPQFSSRGFPPGVNLSNPFGVAINGFFFLGKWNPQTNPRRHNHPTDLVITVGRRPYLDEEIWPTTWSNYDEFEQRKLWPWWRVCTARRLTDIGRAGMGLRFHACVVPGQEVCHNKVSLSQPRENFATPSRKGWANWQ